MKYHIDFDIDFKRNKEKGRLIVIEGIDGAGKTTQANQIYKEFSKNNKAYLTKNPTDGDIGLLVRRVLSGEIKIPPIALQFLFSADRQVQQIDIINRLKNGEVIIMDRYFWSSIVYGISDLSGYNFDESGDLLLVTQGILSMYHQFLIPNLSIFLEIPIEVAIDRINKKNKKKEIYENEEKLNKIHKGYKWLIEKFENEFTIIDGTKSEKEITQEIVNLISYEK